MNIETRKMARKNHRIISRGVLFCIAPPVPPHSSLSGEGKGHNCGMALTEEPWAVMLYKRYIDFQIINFTRIEGGRRISYTSTTDNAVKLII
jgi:hypothetical protein